MFGYEYKTSEDYSADLRTRYPNVTSFADSLTAEMQNPSYNSFDFDAWGSYRPGGAARLKNRFQYIPQNDTSTWDPAAWQLKWVRDPSGGEIHVQYEEDEYAFVHDRPAMALVSIYDEAGGGWQEQSDDTDSDNKYFLRLSDIGVDSTDYDAVAKVKSLLQRYDARQSRLFFRFLYALKGDSAQLDNPEYNSEYIHGYADIDAIEIQTINSGDPDEWYALYVKLIGRKTGGGIQDGGVPKQVCLDYVHKRKRGKLSPGDGIPYRTGSFRAVEMIWDLMGFPAPGFNESSHCKDIDYAHSYVRIPLVAAKKGGGLRVKRLLSFDPGLEGDTTLFGSEYRYERFDPLRNEVVSSGVAANEPATMRSENPLIDFIPGELKDDDWGKVIALRDIPKYEGPIGEALLPSASVGYARVAKHPIYQGRTASGFSVSDFFTYKDYPFDTRYEGLGRTVNYTDIKDETYRTPFPLENFIVFQQSTTEVRATQGYRFILHDFHGRPKSSMSNGGTYSPYERDWLTSGSMEYVYFQPGDSLPLLYSLGDTIRYGRFGKEMEVIHAARNTGSYIKDLKIEGDAGFWFLSGAGYYAVNNSELFTHVTTKVTKYPAVIKGVLAFTDGNYNYIENTAFDPESGLVVLRTSSDGFDGMTLQKSPSGHNGKFHAYTVPRGTRYPELGSIAGNERAWINTDGDLNLHKGSDSIGTYVDFPGGSETRWLNKLSPGDFIELTLVTPNTPEEKDAGRYHVDKVRGNVVYLIPSFNFNEVADSVALARTGEVYIEVVHSGRANSPGMAFGGLSTYGQTTADVQNGVNIQWQGVEAERRFALVDTLNAVLSAGSGTISVSNVDSLLEFRHVITGSCGTLAQLGASFSISQSGDADTVFVAIAGYADTLLSQGRGGYFDLDEAGQVVFRSLGNFTKINLARLNPTEQRLLGMQFCGSGPVLKSVAGTISAFAGAISDTVDWDGNGVASVEGALNAYEKGERGRWSVRTGYSYRTSVIGSNDAVAGERIYKDAGVYNDFSLFNWAEPDASDMAHWDQNDVITHINKHNIPTGSVNRLGLHSVLLSDYGQDRNHLPVLSVWNAEQGTAGFESFEVYDFGDFGGEVTDLKAHAGKHSIKVTDSGTTTYTMDVILNDHLLDKGALVNFWSTDDAGELHVKYESGSVPDAVPVKIARVGEWVLYEAVLRADTLSSYFVVGDTVHLSFRNTGANTIFVDDIKFLPTDALSGASAAVYDPTTYRPLAFFDDRHFGTYFVYNGQGKMFATVLETERGVRTMGDVHGHVAGVKREWQGTGSPYYGTVSGGDTPYSMESQSARSSSNPTSFDISSIHLGLDNQQLTVFGRSPSELIESIKQSWTKAKNLSTSQLSLIDRYSQLYERQRVLLQEKSTDVSDDRVQEIDAELEQIRAEASDILKQIEQDEQ